MITYWMGLHLFKMSYRIIQTHREEDRFKEKILIAKGIMDIPVPEFSISNRLDLLNRLNALQCVVEIQTDLESSFLLES